MEILSIVNYGITFTAISIAIYLILRFFGIVGKATPAVQETTERGTKKVKATRSHVLIWGASGAGKTALINYLGVKEWRETVSSLDISKATFTVSWKISPETTDDEAVSKSVKLKYIDVPGHHHFLDDLLDSAETASAIIFVIDSRIRETIPLAAEILYEILNSTRVVVEEKLPIMIVCNKQDLQYSRKLTEIEIELEKEIEELKRSHVATRDPDKEYIGYIESLKGRFEFKNVSDFIQFCEASVKDGNVSEIAKFIVKRHIK